jgi:hypothetical protein
MKLQRQGIPVNILWLYRSHVRSYPLQRVRAQMDWLLSSTTLKDADSYNQSNEHAYASVGMAPKYLRNCRIKCMSQTIGESGDVVECVVECITAIF